MNMITIDAHSRDMIEQVAESGSDDVESFQWVCQLRTYWDKSIDDCRVRICDASFPYGYEYLGNGPRLVITPLTDRIYITATQVLPPIYPLCTSLQLGFHGFSVHIVCDSASHAISSASQ